MLMNGHYRGYIVGVRRAKSIKTDSVLGHNGIPNRTVAEPQGMPDFVDEGRNPLAI